MKTKLSAKSYGIKRTEYDQRRTHGWIVRLQRRGRSWQKFFSDGLHGGKQGALVAAMAFRDEVVRDNPPLTRAEYARTIRSNNTSGVPGVCRYVEKTVRGNRIIERAYWIAFWPPMKNGKVTRRKFSVDRFGDDDAFRRAIETRHKALEELPGFFLREKGLRVWLQAHSRNPDEGPHYWKAASKTPNERTTKSKNKASGGDQNDAVVQCLKSNGTVRKARAYSFKAGWDDRKIADQVGVSEQHVAQVRRALYGTLDRGREEKLRAALEAKIESLKAQISQLGRAGKRSRTRRARRPNSNR